MINYCEYCGDENFLIINETKECQTCKAKNPQLVKFRNEKHFHARYTLATHPHSIKYGNTGKFSINGDDIQTVLEHNKKNPDTVWTIVSSNKGNEIIAGFHIVNRLSYLITNEKKSFLIERYLTS